MYDWPSVATTGLSEVASPLSPITKSLPAARPCVGARPSVATSSASTMAWITSVLRSRRVSAQGRIRRVAQPIAEQVEPQHGDEDGEPGERRDPPGRGQKLPAFDDHIAPARPQRAGAGAPRPQGPLHQQPR